ncbi:MAG: YccF domain-containing protein [Candidatus Promineifilaceae bacterium]
MSNITYQKTNETPFIIRALWFILLGWELTLAWIGIAWFLNLTIIGLPLGLWMLNRVPQTLTLKSMGGTIAINEKNGDTAYLGQSQYPLVIRAVYFALIGWWASLIWVGVGYLLCLTIIFMPFGLVMLNQSPFVTTLGR